MLCDKWTGVAGSSGLGQVWSVWWDEKLQARGCSHGGGGPHGSVHAVCAGC